MLHCIKTGFYASLPNGKFIYGDAFGLHPDSFEASDGPASRPDICLLLRVCSMSIEKPRFIHIRLETWDHWFDQQRGEHCRDYSIWTPNSTLIASPGQWSWLGYNGEPA